MSSCSHDLFDTAQKVAALANPTESDTRAAVSRAYYSALHAVAFVYQGDEDLSHRANSHETIIGRAEAHGNSMEPGRTEARQVARDMKRFKALRKIADYRLNEGVPATQGAESIRLAGSVIKRCLDIQQKRSHAKTTV